MPNKAEADRHREKACMALRLKYNKREPRKTRHVDLNAARQLLQDEHEIFVTTPMVLVFDYKGHEVSIFKRGRMLIKNVKTETDALRIYMEIDKMIRN